MSRLTPKEEAFATEVVRNGGDKVAAYEKAGYSMNMSAAAIAVQADKIYNKPKINLKVKSLQKIADKVANEKFTISIEQRLRWLDEVARGGLNKQIVMQGETMIEKHENLPATTGAIKIMNEMLGTDENNDKTKPVKVFIGVQDAS